MESPSADLISLVLGTLRTDRAVTARFSLTAPWALRSEGVEGLLVRVCTGTPYWIQVDGQAAVHVQPGDIVMLPQGGPHVVASSPGLDTVPFRTLLQQHMRGAHGDHPLTFEHGAPGGEATELFSLHLWMPQHQGGSLLSWLPPLIVLRAADIATTRSLSLATQALVDETLSQRPGWQLATARMADLLLVHVLREHLHSGPADAQGWLNGVRDKAIGKALMQMHAHPELPWSLASLARVSHQSRTVFSERFLERMGTTPLRYLTSVRMGIARQQFLKGADDVWRVAQSVGYGSEKAFSRAFERWSGSTPSQCIKSRTIGTQMRRPEG
ncbi:AraC family transcriptional regulator [Hydrogenophaga sp. BPS33]|uniref:AraC family transcriptional regulator n=1 Tax=Hydrogenophaga sp. BPS33 TaxID=2651974 RepID=UPI00131F6A38|nr:AraC family transcriptional regulator [Hydrogenophaga sp. BPS33]QHE85652.1 AraC family transcriptional regulator [Hydrogenophaga sp. BPS33]